MRRRLSSAPKLELCREIGLSKTDSRQKDFVPKARKFLIDNNNSNNLSMKSSQLWFLIVKTKGMINPGVLARVLTHDLTFFFYNFRIKMILISLI
ncbi:unnamed protein product [Brassica oleracea]|uniref:(rape) hypothetical protein n=1 Tax=Brassica napus TaxID=3708 RepID=A0A816K9P1_BRANA|nr:unnamed protein product [Brassica napus]